MTLATSTIIFHVIFSPLARAGGKRFAIALSGWKRTFTVSEPFGNTKVKHKGEELSKNIAVHNRPVISMSLSTNLDMITRVGGSVACLLIVSFFGFFGSYLSSC